MDRAGFPMRFLLLASLLLLSCGAPVALWLTATSALVAQLAGVVLAPGAGAVLAGVAGRGEHVAVRWLLAGVAGVDVLQVAVVVLGVLAANDDSGWLLLYADLVLILLAGLLSFLALVVSSSLAWLQPAGPGR